MNNDPASNRDASQLVGIVSARIVKRGRWGWVFSWLGLIGLAGMVIPPCMTDRPVGPATIFYYTFIICVLLLAVMGRRYIMGGIGDPGLLFALMFLLYNVGLMVEFGWQALAGSLEFRYYGGDYGINDMGAIARCVAAAAAGLCMGMFLLSGRSTKRRPIENPHSLLTPHLATHLFSLGAICLVSVMLLTVLIVVGTGGITAFLASARSGAGGRINPSIALGIGIPLVPFSIAGIACMVTGFYAAPVRRRVLLFIVIIVLFTVFNFVQGVRHLAAYLVVMVFGAYATFIKPKRGQLIKLALFALCIYVLFAFVSGIRWILPDYFGGRASSSEVSEVIKSFSRSGLLPSRNEFSGPYFTILETWSNPSELRRGVTYASAVLSILPTSLYPGAKPSGLAADFAFEIGQRWRSLEGIGFGYSPVAEALVNYGFWGIPVVFIGWALVWHGVGAWRRRHLFANLACLVLLPQVLNANRYSLDGVLQEAIYALVAVYVLYLIARRRAT